MKALVEQAFTSECGEFAERVLTLIAKQREAIHRRIEELEALESELKELEHHVRLCGLRRSVWATPMMPSAPCPPDGSHRASTWWTARAYRIWNVGRLVIVVALGDQMHAPAPGANALKPIGRRVDGSWLRRTGWVRSHLRHCAS